MGLKFAPEAAGQPGSMPGLARARLTGDTLALRMLCSSLNPGRAAT